MPCLQPNVELFSRLLFFSQGSQKPKSNKRKSDVTLSSSNGQKKTKNFEVSSGSIDCSSVGLRSPAAGGGDSHTDEQNSIRQLAEIALQADRMEGNITISHSFES